jgi:hypothetical protein
MLTGWRFGKNKTTFEPHCRIHIATFRSSPYCSFRFGRSPKVVCHFKRVSVTSPSPWYNASYPSSSVSTASIRLPPTLPHDILSPRRQALFVGACSAPASPLTWHRRAFHDVSTATHLPHTTWRTRSRGKLSLHIWAAEAAVARPPVLDSQFHNTQAQSRTLLASIFSTCE